MSDHFLFAGLLVQKDKGGVDHADNEGDGEDHQIAEVSAFGLLG
jgi:hypothetical protein|eukprot:CAMPEP_0174301710 /NCGR_PEP_ID=MMETSP0809-20121228/59205_1 /TAXON_ID=73025 ORGANISM="Eutreptiella gymnastica-like, Strain CCMP1594" /NCGR_SAMPLE_ID=MMETSP0809 /ASSEMBLY_ACC=CAM_ASM_000658 /LENGTH=43 /DNA_ID= /DNA_START= /DNA_END= /DNA_ORIENTATION=